MTAYYQPFMAQVISGDYDGSHDKCYYCGKEKSDGWCKYITVISYVWPLHAHCFQNGGYQDIKGYTFTPWRTFEIIGAVR